jgi:hypothetical protein
LSFHHPLCPLKKEALTRLEIGKRGIGFVLSRSPKQKANLIRVGSCFKERRERDLFSAFSNMHKTYQINLSIENISYTIELIYKYNIEQAF